MRTLIGMTHGRYIWASLRVGDWVLGEHFVNKTWPQALDVIEGKSRLQLLAQSIFRTIQANESYIDSAVGYKQIRDHVLQVLIHLIATPLRPRGRCSGENHKNSFSAKTKAKSTAAVNEAAGMSHKFAEIFESDPSRPLYDFDSWGCILHAYIQGRRPTRGISRRRPLRGERVPVEVIQGHVRLRPPGQVGSRKSRIHSSTCSHTTSLPRGSLGVTT
ncbi:hypothetical protein DAEQUDRAFT_78709 [Daedalea quercina L-15889]|uniref:Uncharacterized protein n=1 Tax=Daedalea quercina L-15889 TaxID=1314783 RepID=A0A165SG87_9APHY|nr:hypothetical protein DAEQUDRAFT_78709 [Daedalea quercina L-15889]